MTPPAPASALGPLIVAALAGGSRLRLARNRFGSYTADLLPSAAGAAEIGATMETPAAALEQLERAIAAHYAPPPVAPRSRPTLGLYRFEAA